MLKNRPAAFLCLVFSAGMAAGLFFTALTITEITAVGAIAAIILYRVNKKPKLASFVAFAMVALLLGVLYSKTFSYLSKPVTPQSDTKYTFTAAVRDTDERSSYTFIEAEVQDDASPFNGERFCMYLYGGAPRAGELINVTGKMRLGENYLKANGISYVVTGEYTLCENRSATGFYFKVLRFRQKVGNVIDKAYGEETASFYKALLTGDRSGLTTEFNAAFSRSGLSHIMAISGQHFTLIIFNIYCLLMLILRRKKLCCVIAIILAIAYTVFTGASPSIIRAAFMCCVVFVTAIGNEQSDPLINLSVALVVLLLFNPYSILNTSLQLSFLATAGIVFTFYHLDLFYETHKVPRWLKTLIAPAAMSVAASLFCTPVFLSSFDYISLLSPFANILVNWLISAAMICGIVILPLAIIINEAAIIPRLLYQAIKMIAEWVAGMRYACVSVDMPYIKLLFLPSLFTVFTFAAFRPKKGIKVFCSAFLATVAIVVACFCLRYNSLKSNALFYVNDGVTSDFAFYTDESISVLIDGNGALGASDAVLKQGYTYIDAYVVTVCTENSVKRLKRTLPYTPINTVYIPSEENEYTKGTLRFAAENGCRIVRFSNKNLRLGALTVYTPDSEYEKGGYLIEAVKNGTSLSLLGPADNISGIEISDRDAVVITRACTAGDLDLNILPYTYGRIIIYGEDENGTYEYIKDNEMAYILERYEGDLLLRFGRAGVVKER